MHDLARDKDNAERDRRLDWFGRNMNESQSSCRECNAVSNSESGDGSDELAPSLHENKQRQHEQQMIDAEKNVLDAEHEVSASTLPARPARLIRRTTATMV